ncbi:MAG: TlpA family protein disulfide reductase [Chromatiales bacterium]|nr:TlpA family protein disulfide reductase [Chromatiales bacterium]
MQRRDLLVAMGMSAFAPLASAVTVTSPVETLGDRPPMPDFELIDLDGKVHRPEDYRGRVLVVNFWATWCPPCRAEMPSMERMMETWKHAPLSLIAIAMGQNEKQVRRFADENPLSFPLLPDPDGKVSEAFGVDGLPTTYIANELGNLAFKVTGGREWDSDRMTRTISLILPPKK